MRMILNKDLIRIPPFSSMALLYSYAFLVAWELLDGITTKIGLNLGLAEVGIYARGILDNYGFWGLMAWKFVIITALGVMYALIHYGVKKYVPSYLKSISIILSVICFLSSMFTVQVVLSNIAQIQLALHS
jgi:hypothetical protein